MSTAHWFHHITAFFLLGILCVLFTPWWLSIAFIFLTAGTVLFMTLRPNLTWLTLLWRGLFEFLGFVLIMGLLTAQVIGLGLMLQ